MDKKTAETDITPNAGNLAVAAAKTDTPAVEKVVEEKDRAFISKGEKIHKWTTYLGVDWVFNTAVGVSFAYWGKFTESGKRIWSENLNKGFTALLKPIIKNPASLESSVGKGNMFMSIIAGGMFTIPPLMALENNKVRKSIIKFFDKKIYGKEAVENDPKFEKAYDEIEHAPKKDFETGMWSRFAALAPLLAIVLVPKTRDLSNKYYFEHVSNLSEGIGKTMGFGEHSFKGVEAAEAKKRWKFIHDSVAMDSGLCLPYAGLHAFFYNLFANKKARKLAKQEANAQDEATTLPPATPTDNRDEQAASTDHADKIAKLKTVEPRGQFTDYAQKPSDQAASIS